MKTFFIIKTTGTSRFLYNRYSFALNSNAKKRQQVHEIDKSTQQTPWAGSGQTHRPTIPSWISGFNRKSYLYIYMYLHIEFQNISNPFYLDYTLRRKIYRISIEWPLIKFICKLHTQFIVHKNREIQIHMYSHYLVVRSACHFYVKSRPWKYLS